MNVRDIILALQKEVLKDAAVHDYVVDIPTTTAYSSVENDVVTEVEDHEDKTVIIS